MTLQLCARVVLVMLTVCPASASAQETSNGQPAAGAPPQESSADNPLTRPFRGLFGLGDSGRSGLDVSGSLFGAYNDNLSETVPGASPDPRYQSSGWLSGAQSRLSYNWSGERASVGAWATAGTAYYINDRSFVPHYSGGVGFSRPLGSRVSFRASQVVAYSPFYVSGFFAALPTVIEPTVPDAGSDQDLAVADDRILRSSTSASLNRQLSRKASISASYGLNISDYVDTDRRYTQQYGSVSFRRQLTSHATFRAGYGYRTGKLEDPFAPANADLDHAFHDIDIGVDYGRAVSLSMSRRTKLSFSTSSSIFVARDVPVGNAEPRSRRHLFVGGTASLAHEMGRTWHAALIYSRSAEFSDLLFEPVTRDAVSASVSGLIGRRNELGFLASTSRGDIGFGAGSRGFDSYLARAQWRRAVSANLAAFVNYTLYHHSFSQLAAFPLGFPPLMDRQSVQFGLSVWLPLYGRGR